MDGRYGVEYKARVSRFVTRLWGSGNVDGQAHFYARFI